MNRILLLLLFAAGLPQNALAKPPEWTQSFPTGVQQGQVSEITLTGTFEHWPPQVYSPIGGLEITPSEDAKKKSLTIKAAPDAPVGMHLLRLFDQDGATALQPFFVSPFVEEVEKSEANNELVDAQEAASPATISGKLEKGGDVDSYRTHVKANQHLVVSLRGHRWLGAPMDAVLQICDDQGFVLNQNDDSRGLDPLVTWKAPADTEVYVRVFAFPSKPNSSIAFSGASTYIYRLEITSGPYVDHCLPLTLDDQASTTLYGWNLPSEINGLTSINKFRHGSFTIPEALGVAIAERLPMPAVVAKAATPDATGAATAMGLTPPCVVSGRFTTKGERHRFSVQAKKGERLKLNVDSRSLGFLLDPIVQVADSDGKVVGEADDRSRNDQDATLEVAFPADGAYEIQVRDTHGHSGDRMAYRMEVRPPSFNLTVEAHQFVIEAGKPLEVKVTVAREKGFSGEVKLEALDLPDGITAEPVVSEAKGDTAKAVTLKLTSDGKQALQGPFRIVGVLRVASTWPHITVCLNLPQSIEQLWVTAKKT